jgi:excisionase family DNA binding protein
MLLGHHFESRNPALILFKILYNFVLYGIICLEEKRMNKALTTELPELLDAKQVAAYLKLHEVTVINFARQGKLPGFKVGREWRFRADEIRDWIKSRERSQAAFASRFDALWERLGRQAKTAGYEVADVPQLIREVRQARKKITGIFPCVEL